MNLWPLECAHMCIHKPSHPHMNTPKQISESPSLPLIFLLPPSFLLTPSSISLPVPSLALLPFSPARLLSPAPFHLLSLASSTPCPLSLHSFCPLLASPFVNKTTQGPETGLDLAEPLTEGGTRIMWRSTKTGRSSSSRKQQLLRTRETLAAQKPGQTPHHQWYPRAFHNMPPSGFSLPQSACIASPWHTLLMMPLLFARFSLGERAGKKSTEGIGRSSECSPTAWLENPRRQRRLPAHFNLCTPANV